MKHTSETLTSIVTRWLRREDDFRTAEAIREGCGLDYNQVNATLHWLKRCGVVACVEGEGRLWWFALPPTEDKRSRPLDARAPETKPRKRRVRKEKQDG